MFKVIDFEMGEIIMSNLGGSMSSHEPLKNERNAEAKVGEIQ